MLEPNALKSSYWIDQPLKTKNSLLTWDCFKYPECILSASADHDIETYLQPAVLNRVAYIFPISPMPIMPIVMVSMVLENDYDEFTKSRRRKGNI